VAEDLLPVRLHGQPIGTLSIGPGRTPEDWRLTYEARYLGTAGAMPLSVSLPLRDAAWEGAVVRNWFCNLLPEGAVREAIERKLRIPPRDDFALLEALGGECAGAVAIGPPPADARDTQQRELDTLVWELGPDLGDAALALLGAPHRLSLAGAQDKIPVVLGAQGQPLLPGPGEPSTHILKPDSTRLRHLRDLEALGLRLARAVGLAVVDCALVDVGGRRALRVTRYDRDTDAVGGIQRIHQEDFCQALGYPGELKYEVQGGPSLGTCADLLRQRLRLGPQALMRFLDGVLYSVAIGNADAHAKNLSLLHRPGATALAPLYDLVPVIALPESMLSREPALRIGGAERIDAVGSGDLDQFADAIGVRPVFARRRAIALAGDVAARAGVVAEALVAEGGDPAALRAAARIVGDNAAAFAARLAARR
jgi:serine/threonine-protein kinase HipA